jgi:hypothetical protein
MAEQPLQRFWGREGGIWAASLISLGVGTTALALSIDFAD